MRLKIIENIVFLLIAFILCALVYMQLIKGEHYFNQSVNNRIRVIPIEGPRGRIIDSKGLVLADNRLAYHVAVIPQDMNDQASLFEFLGQVLKKSPEQLKKIYIRKKRTPFSPVILSEGVDQKTILTIEESRFQYPGLVIEQSYSRTYPFGKSSSHAVGYIGKIDPNEAEVMQDYGYNVLSMVGKMGVEKTYDSILRGESGGRQIEINNRGREVRLLGLKDPLKGKDLQLTIDQRIQSAADEFLDSRAGAVVIMDLTNGHLLGLSSSPSFDPNAFEDKSRQNEIVSYMQDSRGLLLNRPVAGLYPPGSVFKVPVALSGLELKKITPSMTFDCPGYYMLGQAKFGCAHVHHTEDLRDAIAHSCNVYFYRIGQLITAAMIEQYAKAFGLGRATGVDLPFEKSGQVIGHRRPGRPWYTGNTLNLSIGQGDTLSTPLQLTVMMAAVANNGIIFRPRIVKAVDNKDLPEVNIKKLPVVKLRDTTWHVVQEGLRAVITDPEGTANSLNGLSGMTIFGKTGTAQAGGSKAHHAWFVGYVRSPKNNFAFTIFLENGGSSANAVELTRLLLSRLQSQGII
jgi:penicillin-binding protein 2